MIFEVTPEQIARLDQQQLVLLLGRLVSAELAKHHIPLRSGTVPVQITIADGGDDGRVEWFGGSTATDWLPSRFVIFQVKRTNTDPSALKKETWTKSSKTSNEQPQLSDALTEVVSREGAYVIVTAAPVVGTNVSRRITAIQEGISATGNNPSLLAAIEVYDCNRLASWTNTHPSVALWLNELSRDVDLHGFQSYDKWGREGSIAHIPFQESQTPRFILKGAEAVSWSNDNAEVLKPQLLQGMKKLIFDFFQSKGKSIQVIGPSGYGKTRFVHQLIGCDNTLLGAVSDSSQVIYCIYDEVQDRLLDLARNIADSGSRSLLVVDDCPDILHGRLNDAINRDGANCKLITIGVETKSESLRKSITVQLTPAADDLIEGIAGAVNSQIGQFNSSFIRELSQGFPRMAVFAAESLAVQDEELSSVENLVDRILWGHQQPDQQALEAVQILSLFTVVGMEKEAASELQMLTAYCDQKYQDIYRNLHRFVGRGVVLRKGDYGATQPVPLARSLANQWIESRPSGSLLGLYHSLNETLKLRMLERLSWLSASSKVQDFGVTLLRETIQDHEVLNSNFGSQVFSRIIHLAPDAAMEHVSNLLGEKTVDELLEFNDGRRQLVWALEKLVFRRQTFAPAAKLLLLLGAAETEKYGNNATGQFVSLYQLYLSGTEATPDEKLAVLDEGLSSTDDRIRTICLQALERMLTKNHFSRSGGVERLGAAAPLEDWRPETYGEVYDFYRAALARLEEIALRKGDPLTEAALKHIGDNLTGMFSYVSLFDELKEMTARLRSGYPNWYKPIKSVNSLLFFGLSWNVPKDYLGQLRAYYDELLPTEKIDLLLLYGAGGTIDIRDPDVPYNRESSDHEYSIRQIENVIDTCPDSATYFFPLVDEFLSGRYHMAPRIMSKAAYHVTDTEVLLNELLEKISSETEISVTEKLVRGILLGAKQKNQDLGLQCLETALVVEELKPFCIDLISAVGLNNDLMRLAIDYVKTDVVEPFQATSIAWDDFLSTVDASLVQELLQSILDKGAAGAWVLIRFLSRWLYSSELKETWQAEIIVQALTNPNLFEEQLSYRGNTEWYEWEQLIKKLIDHGFLTKDVCKQLLEFVISSIELENYTVQLSFDDYGQKALLCLIDSYPEIVWERYLQQRESSEGADSFRLRSLFDADSINSSGIGILDAVPKEISLPWMLEDKPNRLKFVLSWIRLFEGREENRSWAPSFIDFVDSFIDALDQLDPIISRLTSGAFIGNFSSKLEGEREQLIQLGNSSQNSYVKQWVNRTILRMSRDIDEQRRRDNNFEAVNRL